MTRAAAASRLASTAAMLGLLLAGSGCAGREEPRYTYGQVRTMMEQQLSEVLSTLDPKPKLGLPHRLQVPCSGPDDTEDEGTVMAILAYRLTGLDWNNNPQVFAHFEKHWDATGYTITLDYGPRPIERSRRTVARHIPTGFTMGVTQGEGGPLTITAQSPCVWRPDAP